MKKTVLFVILDQFADYEYPFLASALQDGIQGNTSRYEVKTISATKAPIRSIGGFTVLPDYSVEDYPADFAALLLIGGYTWQSESAKAIRPLLSYAMEHNRVVGAICDATVFVSQGGYLNMKKHTGNMVEELIQGGNYTGQERFVQEQAVRDGNLVTANGTAHLEFAKEVLMALHAYPSDAIESNYQFFKQGYIEISKSGGT